ncbi:MAG: phosphoribosyltransferase [Nitrospirae bacterium]|nr:MAG: phosphoribosyltransferase [Nitrospirota bacterium]
MDPLFLDRRDAGTQLAHALIHYKEAPDTLILALPRGGVIVGCEISRALHIPLEVLVTRKLGAPGNPELAMGALSETGYRHLNPEVLLSFGVSSSQLEEEVQRQQLEISRRVERYRRGRPLPPMTGRNVILVDDGVATGATFYASIAALRTSNVQRLVAAIPVASHQVRGELLSKVDEVVILETPTSFAAIGQFYLDFSQVSDEQVVACLEKARTAPPGTDSVAK